MGFTDILTGKDRCGMLNLNSVMIGTKQPKVLAAFYEKVFGKPADMVDSENGFYGWQVGSAIYQYSRAFRNGGQHQGPRTGDAEF